MFVIFQNALCHHRGAIRTFNVLSNCIDCWIGMNAVTITRFGFAAVTRVKLKTLHAEQ